MRTSSLFAAAMFVLSSVPLPSLFGFARIENAAAPLGSVVVLVMATTAKLE